MSLSPSIMLLKLDSSSSRSKSYFKLMPKLVVTSFLSSSLILMPSATSCAVYNKLIVLSSTSIVSSLSLSIIAKFSAIPSSAFC